MAASRQPPGDADAARRSAEVSAELGSCAGFEGLEAELDELRETRAWASPHPHTALDGLLAPEVAHQVIAECRSVVIEDLMSDETLGGGLHQT